MGVGLEYNENLMMRLSESGGGNYYFIESPQSLDSIFRQELAEPLVRRRSERFHRVATG